MTNKITEIRRRNIEAGGRWFDEDKMADTPRFGTVHEGPGGTYFTALHTDGGERRWQLWRVLDDGHITCPTPCIGLELDPENPGSEGVREALDREAERRAKEATP